MLEYPRIRNPCLKLKSARSAKLTTKAEDWKSPSEVEKRLQALKMRTWEAFSASDGELHSAALGVTLGEAILNRRL
jgi:hypothetical protein